MPVEFTNPTKSGFDIWRLRDINTYEMRLAAGLLDLSDCLIAGLLQKIGNYRDSSTFFGNSQGGGLTDSRSGACNQDYFAGKLLLHEKVSFCQSVRSTRRFALSDFNSACVPNWPPPTRFEPTVSRGAGRRAASRRGKAATREQTTPTPAAIVTIQGV